MQQQLSIASKVQKLQHKVYCRHHRI